MEVILKLVCAVVFGAIVGIEREYRSKAAGFRTISLITLGSTVFTILSQRIGGEMSHDRIAANIITGIGFIGAGVIFKNGVTVSGLTTAAAIWVSAAIGICLGIGDYYLAGTTTLLTLVVLLGFEWLHDFIEKKRRD